MSPSDAGASSDSRAKKAAGVKAPRVTKSPAGAKPATGAKPAAAKNPSGGAASNGTKGSSETNPTGFAVPAPAAVPVTPAADVRPEAADQTTKMAPVDPWAAEPVADARETVRTAANSYPSAPAYGPSGAWTGGPAGSLGAPGAPIGASAYQGPVGSESGARTPAFTATVAPSAQQNAGRGSMARRARLKVAHMGPLSVMRIALTFSLCMFIVLLVAVAALWAVLDSSGVFKSIIDAATTLTSDSKDKVGIAPWLTFGRVMLITVFIGAANVIAVTLLSTIGALLYNLCSDFVGGVEVTLVER